MHRPCIHFAAFKQGAVPFAPGDPNYRPQLALAVSGSAEGKRAGATKHHHPVKKPGLPGGVMVAAAAGGAGGSTAAAAFGAATSLGSGDDQVVDHGEEGGGSWYVKLLAYY